MSRRDNSRSRAEKSLRDRQRRKWVAIGCGAVTAAVVLVLVIVESWPERHDHKRDHGHAPGMHGGQLVALGKDDRHHHVEYTVGPTGTIHLYTLGAGPADRIDVEWQQLIGQVRVEGAKESTSVVFRPLPDSGRRGDPTAAFVGKLPGEMLGQALVIHIPRLRIQDAEYDFQFSWKSELAADEIRARLDEEQRTIYLAAAGRYTEADIAAAGRTTAAQRFRGHKPTHDVHGAAGERRCPITRFKADAALSWIVGGKPYRFCCLACIDAFVTTAKERPEHVPDPDEDDRGG